MLVNKTQENAHARALRKVHITAEHYLDTIQNPKSSDAHVKNSHDQLDNAISALRHVNELMNHTYDEDENLKAALVDWRNPNKYSQQTVENIVRYSDPAVLQKA